MQKVNSVHQFIFDLQHILERYELKRDTHFWP